MNDKWMFREDPWPTNDYGFDLGVYCIDCKETAPPEIEYTDLEVNGVFSQLVHKICSNCGSERTVDVDDIHDMVEYQRGER